VGHDHAAIRTLDPRPSVHRAAFVDRWVDENQHLSAAQDGRVETLPVSDREGFSKELYFSYRL